MYRALTAIAIGIIFLLELPTSSAQVDQITEIDQRLHNADSLRRRIKYSDAWNQLAMISRYETEMTTTQLAQYYKLNGVIKLGFGKHDEALESYVTSRKYLNKLTTEKSKVDLVNLFTLEGTVLNKKGAYSEAEEIFLKGIEAANTLPDKAKTTAVRYIYNNLAETYELLGQYDNAVNTNNIVLDILNAQGQQVSTGAGVAHNNLGICYRQLGRNKLAKDHYETAAEIFTHALGPNSRYTYVALGNAAMAIDDYGDAEKAIPILYRRLEVFLEDPGTDQSYIVNTYTTLGFIYRRIGELEKSVASYEKALGKLRSMKSPKRDLEIRILKRLATAEMLREAMPKARQYLDEAFAIQEKHQILSPSDLVRLLGVDATYYAENNQPQEYYDAIKIANYISTNDSINQLTRILNIRPRYIDALIDRNELSLAALVIDSTTNYIQTNKARIPNSELMRVQANIDGLLAKLANANGTAKQALADGLDKKLREHTERLVQATASAPSRKNQRYSCSTCFNIGDLLEALVNLHLQTAQRDKDASDFHLQKIVEYFDIKQSYLTNIWKNEHFSGLPKAQKEHAKELRQRIAAYDLLIFENDSNSELAQKQNALYLDSILVLRPQLRRYISQMASKSIVFDKAFQYNQLADGQGMMLFHQEGEAIHALFADREGLVHHKIPNAYALRAKFKNYQAFCKNGNKGFSESIETLKLGAELYSILLGWLPENTLNSTSRIAIIESYPIEGLPFAALLTKQLPEEARGFRDVRFAVEKHAFSYHQSPSAFFEAQQLSHYGGALNLTALAPSQISNEAIASTTSNTVAAVGLDYASQEVETLIEKFKGTLLKGQQADFNGLVNAFKNSNVVHIASHASSNFEDGEYSYIIITDTTKLSGERLYARTLSELELPADLVVLGACESGSGKLRGGEGTMSLANVFLNAGTQSVLHTSWRVEDKSSQEVLLGFYDELDKKLSLDHALVQSQRKYLQTAGGQYLHPFYWAPFAVSGNVSPIESSWANLLYFGLPIGLLVLLFLFWRQR